ncbi:hypothetical protein KIPB_014104, partial [Kipferlia bialata]
GALDEESSGLETDDEGEVKAEVVKADVVTPPSPECQAKSNGISEYLSQFMERPPKKGKPFNAEYLRVPLFLDTDSHTVYIFGVDTKLLLAITLFVIGIYYLNQIKEGYTDL